MIGVSGRKLVFEGWHCEFEWSPRDLWIGAYWKRIGNAWDLWVCLVPCVPLHISWWYHDPDQ